MREICENYFVMFVPEYTITPNILKNIALSEYNRAIIDATAILPNFEAGLAKEALVEKVFHSMIFLGENPSADKIKMEVEGLTKEHNPKISSLQKAYLRAQLLAETQNFEDTDLEGMHELLSGTKRVYGQIKKYRSYRVELKTTPEEILAEVVELFDWYNSIDAIDTNPILVSGIVKAKLENIQPYEEYNFIISNLASTVILLSKGYSSASYFAVESYFNNSKKDYEEAVSSYAHEDGDFTTWLEYYTEGLATQIANTADKIKILARDTKIAKTTGRILFTPRQERIVEYLQDYGILQNKHFSLLFPNVSEDSILRDLKKLMDEGIIVKRGSTKSSRYELR